MARPIKQGIDYYSKDVKAKHDTKFKYVESQNTFIARLVIYELWDLIYGEEGYFAKFDKIQKVLFLGELPITAEQLDNILVSSFEIGMFSKELYDKYQILTSDGIQKRYMEAVGRRKKVDIIREYFLLPKKVYVNINWVYVDINSQNVNNNPENVDDNTQSKVKESKRNESKRKQSINKATNVEISSIFHFYENNGFGMISPKTQEDFAYWIKDFEKIGATTDDAIKIIIYALEQSVDYNKRSYAYTNKILIDWEQKRLLSVDQVKATKKQREVNNQPNEKVEDDDLGW